MSLHRTTSRPSPARLSRKGLCGLFALVLAAGAPVQRAEAGSGDFIGGLAAGALGATIIHGLANQRPARTYQSDGEVRRVRVREDRPAARSPQTQRAPKENAEAKPIRQDQENLATLGFYSGKPDGQKTQPYESAVVQYTLAKGLIATSVLSDVERALLDTEARQRALIVAIGDPSIEPSLAPRPEYRAQAALKALDLYDGALDGKKGKVLTSSISRWQTSNGQLPTGVLTPDQTRQLMGAAVTQAQGRITAVDAQFAAMSAGARPAAALQAQMNQPQINNQPVPTPPVTLAAAPPTGNVAANAPAAVKIAEPVNASFTPIEQVRADAPVRRPYDVAVVIGNQAYQNGIPEVSYGVRDAEAMRSVLVNRLGFSPDNIILVENASQGDMATIFGNRESYKGKVWKYIDPDGRSKVFVFYSGHGMPDVQSKTPFILPVDANPATVTINGFPLELVYANLEKLNVQRAYVFLDACFSGGSNNKMLIQSASPVFVSAKVDTGAKSDKLTILAASEGDQLASWDDKEGHGLFTASLLRGLGGAADQNTDGALTATELHAYLLENVRRQARRVYGREQTPVLIGDGETVISGK